MLEVKKINFDENTDIDLLKKFINKNSSSTNTFRYFTKREFNVLQNHLITNFYFLNDILVGYGHLDKEESKVWLGLMVDEEYQGRGIGKKIMDNLLNHYTGEIHLSVDKSNLYAIELYKKYKFVIIEDKDKHYIMILKK